MTATDCRRQVENHIGMAGLFLLFLLHILVYVDALLVIDSGRDLSNAWSIAQGEAFPLIGPQIYGTWSLGPVWYYLLAVPFLFDAGTLTFVAVWVGVLGSAKVPLAYFLGRRIQGPSAGILLAALVGLPGWSSVQAMIIAHTSVVESAVLASLLMTLRAHDKETAWRIGVAGLFVSLAIHAHPTAVVVAPWFAMALFKYSRAAGWIWAGLVGSIGVMALWLPLLASEALTGWPQIEATRRFAGQQQGLIERLLAIPSVIEGLFTGWAPLTTKFLVPQLSEYVQVATVAAWFTAAVSVTGSMVALSRRLFLTCAIIGSAALVFVMVSLLRPNAPVYMFYAAFPFVMWASAIGITVLAGRFAVFTALPMLLVAVGMQFGVYAQRQTVVAEGTTQFPGEAVADVTSPVRDDSWVRFWLAASDHRRIAESVCNNAATTTALHGELATANSWAGNIVLVGTCPQVALGGSAAERHVAGLPVAHARILGVTGSRVAGFELLEPARVLHPATAKTAIVDRTYAVDRYRSLVSKDPEHEVRLHVACDSARWLVVNNLMAGLNPMKVVVSTESGEMLTPALVTIASMYFECPSQGAVSAVIDSARVSDIDVFLLP